MKKDYKYFAFISYKSEDKEWAEWFQRELEGYHLPSTINGISDIPNSFRPVFRDVTELEAGDLPGQIEEALDSSLNLVVICSPRSAQSEWVNKEIKSFIEFGEKNGIDNINRIFPFIIEGKPYSEDGEIRCFPEELINLKGIGRERIGGDVKEESREKAFVKVLAGMLPKAVTFNMLWDRYERDKIEKERKEREQRDKLYITQSHYLAEKSILCHENGDNYLAQLLALEALPQDLSDPNERPYVSEAEVALRKCCATRSARLRGHLDKINCVAISPDGKFIASSSDDKTIRIWDVEKGTTIHTIDTRDDGSISELYFSIDGSLLISVGFNRGITYRFWTLDKQMFSPPTEYSPKIMESIITQFGKSFVVQFDGKIEYKTYGCKGLKKGKLRNFPKDWIIINGINTVIYADNNTIFSIPQDKDESFEIYTFPCKIKMIKCFHRIPIAVCVGWGNSIYILDLLNKTIIWEYNKCVGAISDIAVDYMQRFVAISCFDKSIHVLWWNKFPIDRKLLGFKQHSVIKNCIVASNDYGIACIDIILNKNLGCFYEGVVVDFYFDEPQYLLYIKTKGDNCMKVIDMNTFENVFSTSALITGDLNLPKGLYIKDNASYIYKDDKKISVITADNNILTICETEYSSGGMMMAPTLDYVLVVIYDVIYIIDTKSFSIVHTIDVCKNKITAVDISSDGNLVVFGSSDIPIQLWEKNNNIMFNFDSQNISSYLDFVVFTPDNRKIIATFNDNSIKIFEIDDDAKQIKILHNLRHQSIDFFMHGFTNRAISTDSKYMLTGHHKGLPGLDVIDIEKGSRVASFDTNDLCVKFASFTEDNKHIIAKLDRDSYIVYEFPDLQELINSTKQRFDNRSLTEEEKEKFHLY